MESYRYTADSTFMNYTRLSFDTPRDTAKAFVPTLHKPGIGYKFMSQTTFWVTFAEFKMFVVRTKVLRFLY